MKTTTQFFLALVLVFTCTVYGQVPSFEEGPASVLETTRVSENSFDLVWGPGMGSHTMIVVGQQDFDFTPDAAVPYLFDTFFGLGDTMEVGVHVVYNGDGYSAMIENLEPGTEYTVKSYSYIVTPMGADFLPEVVEIKITTMGGDVANFEKVDFTASPNPVTGGKLNILLDNAPTSLYTINVVDTTGRTVLQDEIDGRSTTLYLDYLPMGIYMVQVQSSTDTIVKRVVIQ